MKKIYWQIKVWFAFWGPPLALMGFIFYLSSRPFFQISPQYWLNFLFFKFLHYLEYCFLTFLFFRAWRGTYIKNNIKKAILAAFIAAFFWAVTDEIHQLFVPTRQGALRDIFIDTLGNVSALACIWFIIPTAPKKLRPWVKKLGLL